MKGWRHGHAANGKESMTYVSWSQMRNRCTCTKHRSYPDYGGRGIRVCEWWNDFRNFLADMGERPSKKHSIDRINNDGNYEPGNCRWLTMAEQLRNNRQSHLVTFSGKTQCVVDWAKEMGMCESTLRLRLKKWPLNRAMTEPKHEQ